MRERVEWLEAGSIT